MVAGAVVASAYLRSVHVVVDPLARAHLAWRVGGGWVLGGGYLGGGEGLGAVVYIGTTPAPAQYVHYGAGMGARTSPDRAAAPGVTDA